MVFFLVPFLLVAIRGSYVVTDFQANLGSIALSNAFVEGNPGKDHLMVALARLGAANQQDNGNSLHWAKIGLAHFLQGDPAEATSAWQNSTLAPEELLLYGLFADSSADSQMALQIMDSIILLRPGYGDSWYYKGDFLVKEGDYWTAIKVLEEGAIQMENGRFGKSDFLLRIGEIYALHLPEADYEAAKIRFTQAIMNNDFKDNIGLIRSHFLMAEAHRILDQPKEAIAEYEFVLSSTPNHYWANVRLGQLLWAETHSFDEAEAMLLQAISSNSQEKGAYKILGAIYLENGRLDEALAMYQQVLAIDPTDRQALNAQEQIQSIAP